MCPLRAFNPGIFSMLISHRARQHGFSLIEMMVAMVIGLIVTGAVVAFIASMMTANTQTLSATRLNSELRTSAELVSRELRRAAYVLDPIEGIGTGCRTSTGGNTAIPLCPYMAVRDITISANGDCMQFVYQVPNGSTFTNRFQAIRVANGALQMGVGNAAVACSQATTRVSSSRLNLTSVGTFATNPAGGVDVSMRGTLTGADEAQKTYRTVVAVRSGGV